MSKIKAEKCPLCGSELEIDEEYMLGTYGAAYVSMPRREWVFWCRQCDLVYQGDELPEHQKTPKP